jgi:hypothetical protein
MHQELAKTSVPKIPLRKPVRSEDIYQPGIGQQEEKPGAIKVIKHTALDPKARVERQEALSSEHINEEPLPMPARLTLP